MRKIERLPILAVAFLTIIATAAIGPALGTIELSFPNASPTLIKSIVTIPALICIPVSLLSNKISKDVRKKYLLIFGLIVYLIGAVLCYFADNIYILLASRGIFGIGLGIIAPMSLVLVGDFFEGKERAKYMGYSSASTNIGGVVVTPIIGFIAAANWHNIFLIYLIALPILILVIFFLPKVAPFDAQAPENLKKEVHKETKHVKLNLGVFKYAIIIILAFVTFYSVPTNIALLIQQRNLGSDELSSLLIALDTLFAFISAALFGRVLKIFKESLILISFILITIGLVVLISATTVTVLCIGIILIGIGFGLIVPYSLYYGAKCVHVKHTSLAITIVTTSIYVGEAICPIILDYISSLLNMGNVIGSFYSATILAVVAIIFSIIVLMVSKIGQKNKKIVEEDENMTVNEEIAMDIDALDSSVTQEISYNDIENEVELQKQVLYKESLIKANREKQKELVNKLVKENRELNIAIETLIEENNKANALIQEKPVVDNDSVKKLMDENKKLKTTLLVGVSAIGVLALYLLRRKKK